jgi:cellulose synthase/poly-beta-1,6-N-acetylglucosamine synthase-like glycosyltransferase
VTPRLPSPTRLRPGLALTGLVSLLFGITMYLAGVVFAFVFLVATQRTQSIQWTAALIWYSGIPTIAGITLVATGLIFGWSRGRISHEVREDPLGLPHLTIVLTAFNDEESIGLAVADFLTIREPREVIVVDNNSRDSTAQVARDAGARVVVEDRPGYGWCVFRSLFEGVQGPSDSVVILCEGDRTFRSADVDKLLAYLVHADIANGTRTTSGLVQRGTQLTPAMHFGNLIAGKLLDLKYPGLATITDLGTTYKAIRRSSLASLLKNVDPNVNLEFNAHLLDRALEMGLGIVEVPITFWPRVGQSKGGNVNHRRAAMVGLRMVTGIVFGWRRRNIHLLANSEQATLQR